ncbi:unnamed protein product [Pocillopora meandrina]|uniref:Uncharacterized protein n=1 Tax=Pocillopora meandrina TaxID=46732 RepID=A0AAU9WFL1_9CNID|nr:unnamed protein product [Pocillopora meandrina]
MMEGETIFVQTDPAFNVVLLALQELRHNNRFEVTHCQRASIEDIESNDEQEVHKLRFGGQNAPNMASESFGRTASAVLRMCMLKAAGINEAWWPQIGPRANTRNQAKLQLEVLIQPLFSLANDRSTARHYWWKYDQLYPHFRIQDTLENLNINDEGSMPSMMLIFRNNCTEVIEINTTFTARPREQHQFNSTVSVTCIVREILEGKDRPHTARLKELIQPFNIPDEYFKEVMNLKDENDARHYLQGNKDDENSEEVKEEDSEEDSKDDSKESAN